MSLIDHNLIGPREQSGESNDRRVAVYRVIDAVELAYLRIKGDYGPNPNGSGKYFALTLVGARAFAAHPINTGRTITETTLPRSILALGSSIIEPGPNSPGPSVHFDETELPVVYSAMTPAKIVT
jgi:hypothetical protein